MRDVSHRYGSGIIPPVPSKHTSSILSYYSIPLQKLPGLLYFGRHAELCKHFIKTLFAQVKMVYLSVLATEIPEGMLYFEASFLQYSIFHLHFFAASVAYHRYKLRIVIIKINSHGHSYPRFYAYCFNHYNVIFCQKTAVIIPCAAYLFHIIRAFSAGSR